MNAPQVSHLFAGIPTADLPRALRWYEQFFGRGPDNRPNEDEAVWQLTESGLIYVVADAARAGNAVLTVIVRDVAAEQAQLERRGIRTSAIEPVGKAGRKVVVRDPDTNELSLAELFDQE